MTATGSSNFGTARVWPSRGPLHHQVFADHLADFHRAAVLHLQHLVDAVQPDLVPDGYVRPWAGSLDVQHRPANRPPVSPFR
jgi:hypothetical protein